jgi:hypothetical protein
MQIANVDSVDIFLTIFFPPIGTLIVYGGAYAAARAVGGQPLSQTTKTILRYGSFFVLGMGYLIMILGTLKLPDWSLWAAVAVWGLLLSLFIRRRQDKHRKNEDAKLSPPT